jgi:hypothetical protein
MDKSGSLGLDLGVLRHNLIKITNCTYHSIVNSSFPEFKPKRHSSISAGNHGKINNNNVLLYCLCTGT